MLTYNHMSQDSASPVHAHATLLLKQGHSKAEIRHHLMDQGLTAQDAHTIVRDITNDTMRAYRNLDRHIGMQAIVGGTLVLLSILFAVLVGKFEATSYFYWLSAFIAITGGVLLYWAARAKFNAATEPAIRLER